jgi:acyl-CoA reductase-like NAD-dependent aldehyde dehydrogenase
MSDPKTWQNASPGNLDDLLPEITASPVEDAITRANQAFPQWSGLSLNARKDALCGCRTALENHREALAHSISQETGKPLTEARGELTSVLAKFDLTFEDADQYIAQRPVPGGPHPAAIRTRPRGLAAVIAPFNFPIHLGHGATVAYLLAGNTVLFKPSPLAAATGGSYVRAMQSALPLGAMELIQGGGETGQRLCNHADVRSVCFTGSAAVGRQLAVDLAADYSKSLALELGGKNATIVLDDADLPAAARAIADSFCATAGQRCNATSHAIVHASVLDEFLDLLRTELARYVPGDPLDEATTLGALISAAAVDRYRTLTALKVGDWIVPGTIPDEVAAHRGHYVTPAVTLCRDASDFTATALHTNEAFCPILAVLPVASDSEATQVHNTSPYGLTASIFTTAADRFEAIGDQLSVGNLYQNLPTTFAPSTLPFGGHGLSGNGKPGARGFIRYCADEQAVQLGGSS